MDKKKNIAAGLVSSKAGFTLIEMIIVTTIISILAVSIGTSFVSGMKIWSRAQNVDFVEGNILLSMEIIARDMRQIIDVQEVPLEGNEREVTFISLEKAMPVQITYYFKSGEIIRKKSDLQDIIKEDSEGVFIERSVLSAKGWDLEYLCYDISDEDFFKTKSFEAEEDKKQEDICYGVKINIKHDIAPMESIILFPVMGQKVSVALKNRKKVKL